MGQKVNPNGIRLGITKQFNSVWYANTADYADNLKCDYQVREFIKKELKDASVSKVVIDRPAKSIRVTVFTSRPSVVYGVKGAGIEKLSNGISKIANVKSAQIVVQEVRKPELDAQLVAASIAEQLEHRVMFRRAMKKAIQNATKAGALGVKIEASGRLGGAEIARSEWLREGRVPLHTLRADIDYAVAEAKTTYGIIGVKVWIFKGEVLGELPLENEADNQQNTKAPKKNNHRGNKAPARDVAKAAK